MIKREDMAFAGPSVEDETCYPPAVRAQLRALEAERNRKHRAMLAVAGAMFVLVLCLLFSLPAPWSQLAAFVGMIGLAVFLWWRWIAITNACEHASEKVTEEYRRGI